jgi:hypothetical protein
VDPANLPLPPFNISTYSAFIERNDVNSKITEEIREFYDGINDIAIAVNILSNARTVTYSYAKIDELLLVSGKYLFIRSDNLDYYYYFYTNY